MKQKVLVVDDDDKTRTLLKKFLEKNHYEVIEAHDGASFMVEFQRYADALSLVILDVTLPDTDGFMLCRLVRHHSHVPIIMLTASSSKADRVIGLELGADDYIAKPYSPRELLARIKAIQRRIGIGNLAAPPRVYRFVGFTLNAIERTLTDSEGTQISLTGMDFELLKYFLDHPGIVLNRDALCEETRGFAPGPFDRFLDVQISRLRTYLRDDGKKPFLIKTVRGAGYVFSANVSVSYV